MTTTGLSRYIDGIDKIFGEDVPIDAAFKLVNAYDFDSSQSQRKASMKGDLCLVLVVNYQNGTTIDAYSFEFQDINIEYSILIDNMTAKGRIDDLFVNKIFIKSDYFEEGEHFDVSILKVAFNSAFEFGMYYFNSYFDEYAYEIPCMLLRTFKLSDLTLNYYDHYIQIGATPTFIPPENVTQIVKEGFKKPVLLQDNKVRIWF